MKPERLEAIRAATNPASATTDYKVLLNINDIDAYIISATPGTAHYPMAKECLATGRHVLMEKPLSLTLQEADELIELAKEHHVKFTIGYSQRFNPKLAYVRKSLHDGTLGEPVAAVVSRHITRGLG